MHVGGIEAEITAYGKNNRIQKERAMTYLAALKAT